MHNYSNAQKINVAIVGSSGYSGALLGQLLKKHPFVEIKGTYNSTNAHELNAKTVDMIFLATPAEVSAELAPKFLAEGSKVIDLSGSMRLKGEDVQALYKKWYDFSHPSVELVKAAHYGLVPWMRPGKGTRLIANPGCYATAVLMGILPLLNAKFIDPESLVIDAKSGTTGAGKKAVESLLFSEVDGECLPYKVGVHQHLPEIQTYARIISGETIDPFFTTSLLPVRRGIIAGIYGKLMEGVRAEDISTAFKEFYLGYPLVELCEDHQLKKVVGTAKTRISFKVVGEKLYLFSCIDNLLKGAASQAVENFNLFYNFPLTAGLDHLEALL